MCRHADLAGSCTCRGEDAGKKLLGRRVLIVVRENSLMRAAGSPDAACRTRLTTRGRPCSTPPCALPAHFSGCARRYAIAELQQDVERELATLPEAEREAQRTKFAVFVVHNKRKPKVGVLPPDVPCVRRPQLTRAPA
jgi:hypothetical protein